MAFDQQWETIFSSRDWGRYPSEEVVRFTARNFRDRQARKDIRILDLGCGAGATCWYLSREGFDVYGVDGSPSAIRKASAYLAEENLTASFSVGDIVGLEYAPNFFDAVYEIGVAQHNRMADIRKIYKEIERVLKPGGLFFSIAINEATSGREHADELEKNTFLHLDSLNQDVLVHLFSKAELEELTAPFKNVVIESLVRTSERGAKTIGHYLISAQKKEYDEYDG
ncbi:putative methyltransferase YcgJ [Pseudodesulfovibrio hydrargyri]|uniref:Putative methyltransferase YcgJ n=1 Tax=Pseudodesulfovibrio hydrargyri TaxID=2125990 RepID=A0A1J5MRJ2_9BACT|nr:class I SAM-dependent methyltransferase [Pseudodesulfovibrio hydrargyri]OIQ49237.1 putative methyltransferase YcgJ [Pseudodesulfovibrio hydrargyri]